MDSLLETAFRQAPALAIVVVVVVVFLRDAARRDRMFSGVISDLKAQHTELGRIVGQNTEVLRQVTELLRRLNGRL